MLSLQIPYIQIFQNLISCNFWNFSIAAIFWQQIYGRMSILMYRKLGLKVSKYCRFILQKPYVQRLDLMSKRWTYGPVALFLWKTLSPYLGHKALVRTTLCPFMDLRSYFFFALLVPWNQWKLWFVCYNAMVSHISLCSNNCITDDSNAMVSVTFCSIFLRQLQCFSLN